MLPGKTAMKKAAAAFPTVDLYFSGVIISALPIAISAMPELYNGVIFFQRNKVGNLSPEGFSGKGEVTDTREYQTCAKNNSGC